MISGLDSSRLMDLRLAVMVLGARRGGLGGLPGLLGLLVVLSISTDPISVSLGTYHPLLLVFHGIPVDQLLPSLTRTF